MTEEQKKKISESHKGITPSEETRKKMSESAKKRPPIKESTREKMSELRKGEKNPMYEKSAMQGKNHTEETKNKMRKPKPKVKCPHCDKIGGISVMYRFHFNNCKLK